MGQDIKMPLASGALRNHREMAEIETVLSLFFFLRCFLGLWGRGSADTWENFANELF